MPEPREVSVNIARGKPVLETAVKNREQATNGVVTGYTASSGYASFDCPGHLTVDLQEDFKVRTIRVLLWDGRGTGGTTRDARRYRYRLLARANEVKKWTRLFETAGEGSNGWHVFNLRPSITLREIRIEGISNSANKSFHVVEVEAYEGKAPAIPRGDVTLEETVSVKPQVRHDGAGLPTLEPHVGRALRRGTVLDCYQLVERLGEGYSAVVWRAKVLKAPPGVALVVDQEVAIKVYRPEILGGVEALRIQKEFAVASQADHPSLARIYDVLISPSRPWHTFLAMELVDGKTLKAYIRDRERLPVTETARVGIQVLEGLVALHELGAIHRDLKAANVMVVSPEDLTLKVLDFGIVGTEMDHSLTGSTVFLGSKHSAPLEQLTGENVDVRADIYALGTVMYNCLEGRAPYEGTGPEGAIVRRMLRDPAAARVRNDTNELEHEVVKFVNRCLSVERASRPQTAASALRELTQIRDDFS